MQTLPLSSFASQVNGSRLVSEPDPVGGFGDGLEKHSLAPRGGGCMEQMVSRPEQSSSPGQ